MHSNALSQMKAKNLEAGKHADGQGLWLFKRRRDAGKWVLRVTVSGRRREMGLGPWPDVSIAEARDRAADARKLVRDGFDPVVEREKERSSRRRLLFHEAVDGCFAAKQVELKGDGKAGRWLSPLSNHILPKIGRVPVEDIDQHVLRTVLEPIWHKKADTARKALNRINLSLKHAAVLGLNVDLQATMKLRSLLGKQRHTTVHIPSLPYEELPEFYGWLETKNLLTAKVLQFLILTCARTSEVRLATFDEFLSGVWHLPAERTKTGREHRIPLSNAAQSIVDAAYCDLGNTLVFPARSGKPLTDVAMSAFMKREGYIARPHGFRASFRTWMEEQTDYTYEVKELSLGHQVGDKTVRAYQRSDHLEARTQLMNDWAIFVIGQSRLSG